MEQTERRQYEKKKEKHTLQSKPVKFFITQHNDMWMFKKARQSSHYKITKNVYMSSNIFVLYYIQLSLLKMEYRWLLYCRRGGKIATLHVTGRTVTWFSEVQFAVVWEKKTVDWCSLKWDLLYQLLVFCSFLGARIPSRTHWQPQAPQHRFRKSDGIKALLLNYIWHLPLHCNWHKDIFTKVSQVDRCYADIIHTVACSWTSASRGWNSAFLWPVYHLKILFLWQNNIQQE